MESGTGFVDVRSPEEFRGEKLAPDHLPQEQAQVPGHIAGAANIPWAKAANEDGTFKSADELRALYAAEGITGDGEVIAYCRIGERSSHTWFALQELLGFENVKNYDGSLDRVRLARGGARRAGVTGESNRLRGREPRPGYARAGHRQRGSWMGCLLAIIGALSPRLLFVIIWIARPAYVDAVFDTFIFPLARSDLPSLRDVDVGAPRRAAVGDPRVGRASGSRSPCSWT